MNLKTTFQACALLALLTIVCGRASLQAQQRCQPPTLPATSSEPNIFTAEQEMHLGEAVAEHLQRDFHVIDDDEVNAYLRRVGAALVKQLPETGLRYQFFLFDQPIANAFTLPGGRIYVSRKLVALTRSEDELAGVLAHELGHIVARQAAIDVTRMFKEGLGITSVTDRRDIFEKYNQMVENAARKSKALSRGDNHEEKGQLVADQIGLYALASAGYDPQAQSAFWERLTETKGKTVGWFSDLFGTTKPESRRLREMLKGLSMLPPTCIEKKSSTTTEDYLHWQASVVNYSGLGRKEVLHGVVSKTVLDPPLRGDITHIRFSPDGKYVLAQDDTGINVLTREPFAPAFRIEAPEAFPAQFTPDSLGVVFHSPSLRVEMWSVADSAQKSVREMYVREGCMQSELAPDGRTLACLEPSFALTLYDVATGAQVFQKKDFFKPDFTDLFHLILLSLMRNDDGGLADLGLDVDFVSMRFSPDGRYFAAGQRSINLTVMATINEDISAIIFDRNTNTTLAARGLLKKLLSGKFTFIGPDRIAGVNPQDNQKSAIVSFPGGEVIEQLALTGTPDAVTRGNYLVLRPVGNIPAAIMDMATKKMFGNKQRAFDMYGDVFASERINGELALYRAETRELITKLTLPRNPLGRLRASAISPDLKWLAVSERSRGAVWNLAKGERIFHVRGFRGAYFGDDGALYADFPKLDNTERTIARLNLSSREVNPHLSVNDDQLSQHGQFVVLTKPIKKGGNLRENITLTVSDARNGSVFWTRDFQKESPRVWLNESGGNIVLSWAVKSNHAKSEIKSDARLSQRLAAMNEKEGDYFLQVLDARTGKELGKLLVETGKGSFRITDVLAVGDWVVMTDTTNRVLIYSLASGEQKGKVFGDSTAVSQAGNLLAVENERGVLAIYDLSTMEKRDQFVFSSPVSLTTFSTDGKLLFVLTANQTIYLLNVPGAKN
jgi:WD40 repeat protein